MTHAMMSVVRVSPERFTSVESHLSAEPQSVGLSKASPSLVPPPVGTERHGHIAEHGDILSHG